MNPVADYFEHIRVWRLTRALGNLKFRVITGPSRYPPAILNQYDAVLNDIARANNMPEGWHNKLQMVVEKRHSLHF